VPINVLVVDDSALMRKLVSDILASDPEINIIGKANDGKEAIEKVKRLDPDVVTMDVHMPEMDGVEAVKKIMELYPRPVIMIASKSSEDSAIVVESLEAGAVDFIQKPSGSFSLDMSSVQEEIIKKVKIAAMAKPRRYSIQKVMHHSFIGAAKKIVTVGSSTGGPQTLEQILPLLPKNIPACILVVQHMPPGFTKSLAERFAKISEVQVKEAEEGDEIKEGFVYIAPGDYHMVVERKKVDGFLRDVLCLNKEDKECGVRPSVNVTMRSVAQLYGEKTIGVILTGMGNDGTEGAMSVKKNGGTVIVQDEKSSIIYGMPKCVFESGYYDEEVELSRIAVALIQLLEL
jgi:two-component system chemotaxis response regulator CheB